MKKTNIVSIDLASFFGSLLEQWKCVVTVAVIASVLLSVVMAKNADNEAREEADYYRELFSMSEEDRVKTLPELDQVDVNLALYQKELIEQMDDYYANSIVSKMDFNNLPVLHFHWLISETDNTEALSIAYSTAFADSETSAVVRQSLSSDYQDVDDVYISELITVNSDEGIDLYIVIPEGTDTNALMSGIEDRCSDLESQFKAEFGSHKLTLLTSEETSIVDNIRIAQKAEKDLEYDELKENYTALVLTFDYWMNVVFDTIVNGDQSKAEYTDTGLDLSPKMLAAGFAMGIILYAFCYLVYLIFSSKVHDSSVLTDTLGISLLGEISKYNYKGIGAFVHSKIFYKILHKKTMDEKSIDNAAEKIVASCSKQDCHKVLMIVPGLISDFSDEFKSLKEKINAHDGINAESVSIVPENKELEGYDFIMLCACSGSTKYSELIDADNNCNLSGKDISGGLFFN